MESLGIEGKLLLGQIVNFAILLVLLWIFLYKPIVKMLEERRAKIASSLDNAKKIEENLAQTEEKTRLMLEKAQKEASQLIEEAKKLAREQKDEIVADTKKQADRIIVAAQNEAKSAKDQIISEAKKDITEIVSLALDKIIGKELSDEDKNKLTKKAIAEL